MPLFFNVEVHLWIVYGLFLNGFLLNAILRRVSASYASLTMPIEVQILTAFVFSLLINFTFLLILDFGKINFSHVIYPLLCTTLILAIVAFCVCRLKLIRLESISLRSFVLYGVLFVVLFFNGGLIDQVSDAWWHLSKANRIGWDSSVLNHSRHLTGAVERFYPPLWHSNLALIRELSGASLPSIWNAFTPWGGVLKTMGFYLLGYGLFNNRGVALLGALLFVLLPGIGSAYMRVSSWPSHLSYSIFFASLYLFFSISRKVESVQYRNGFRALMQNAPAVALLSIFLITISMLHLFEILLFFSSVLVFLVACSVAKFVGPESGVYLPETDLMTLLYRTFLLCAFLLSIVSFVADVGNNNMDFLSIWFPPALIALLIFIELRKPRRIVERNFILALAMIFLLSTIDYQHLYSLFDPSSSLPRSGSFEKPLVSLGWGGEKLILPSWDFELRQGLLWSGFLGLFVAIYLVIKTSNQGAIFLLANSVFVWLLCTSPYLYEYITEALNYHSVWRFALLSFHPLILASFICLVFKPQYLYPIRED